MGSKRRISALWLLVTLLIGSGCGVSGVGDRAPAGIQVIPNPISFRSANRSTVNEITLRNTSPDSLTIVGFTSTDPGFYVASRLPFKIPLNGFVQLALGLDYEKFNGTRNVTITLQFWGDKIDPVQLLIDAPSRIVPVKLSPDEGTIDFIPFAVSPNDQDILYKRGRPSSTYHLYTMNFEGRNITQITSGANVNDNGVKWSRSGRYILFNRTYVGVTPPRIDAFLLDTQNDEFIQLSENRGQNLAVDMDASEAHVLLGSNRNGDWEVYTYNLALKTTNRLTTSSGYDFPIKYHPNGEGILFTSNRAGTNQAYAMDIAGGGQRAITTFSGIATPVDISQQGKVLFVGEIGVDRDAYTVNFGGSDVVKLTSGRLDNPHFFSATGNTAFLSSTIGDGVFNVYHVPTTGGVKQRITFGTISEYPVAVTSDNRYLIYRNTRRVPGNEFFLLDLTTLNLN